VNLFTKADVNRTFAQTPDLRMMPATIVIPLPIPSKMLAATIVISLPMKLTSYVTPLREEARWPSKKTKKLSFSLHIQTFAHCIRYVRVMRVVSLSRPGGIARILSNLDWFPNLKEFILDHDFKVNDNTLFDMLTVEEDEQQVPKEERTYARRALLAQAFVAIP
jgi:hypothetical protein